MPGGLTPAQRTLRAQIGAYALHATHDARETTAKARSAFLQRFEDQVDPERRLPESERQRRAEAARSEHFARLALASSRKRSGSRTKATAEQDNSTVAQITAEGVVDATDRELAPR